MIRSLSVALSLLGLAALLTFYIDGCLYEGQAQKSSGSVLYRFIGSAKEGIGDALFLKADQYFHGGVDHHFEHDEGEMEKEGFIESEAEHAHGEIEEDGDWIGKINRQVGVHDHYHLKAHEAKEMLPFLALSVNLDPYHVDAVLTTAYWLGKRFGKIDAAIEVLIEGRKNNPESWEIDADLANYYYEFKHNYLWSAHHYEAAISKSSDQEVPRLKRIEVYYKLAESYSRLARKKEAYETYRSALDLFLPDESTPLRRVIAEKMARLKQE